jgi:hypothetical protein
MAFSGGDASCVATDADDFRRRLSFDFLTLSPLSVVSSFSFVFSLSLPDSWKRGINNLFLNG